MELFFCMQINVEISTSRHYRYWWKRPDISRVPKIGSWLHFCNTLRKKCCNCFWVLLWYKTFRYFTGVQSCSLLLVYDLFEVTHSGKSSRAWVGNKQKLETCNFIKKHSGTVAFLWILWNTFFYRTFRWLHLNPLTTKPTKWSNTLKQFVDCCRQIVWVCLAILRGWRLKG